MTTLDVRTDLAQFAAQMDQMGKSQVRFAAQNALNDCAKFGVADGKARLPEVFDQPTPFTMNAFYPRLGRDKRNLQASVEIRFSAPKGTPAEKYLGPEILGGTRNDKRFERRLDRAGYDLGQLIPAAGAMLDRYGNVQVAQLGAILGNLRAFSETGQNIGKTKLRRLERRGLLVKTSRGMAKYFVAKSKVDGRPLGIWNFLGSGHVVPVLLSARRAPTYTPRLDFDGLMLASYRAHFAKALATRWAEAMKTARPNGGAKL
jgi:hypothetical protein